MTLRLSLTLSDADALACALAVVRPAMRALGSTAIARIDGARLTIESDLPMLAGPAMPPAMERPEPSSAGFLSGDMQAASVAVAQSLGPMLNSFAAEVAAVFASEPEPQDEGAPPQSEAPAPDSEAPIPEEAARTHTPDPRPMSALGAVWTEGDERQILALLAEGLTSRQIGERMGRTTKAVDSRLQRLRKAGAAKPRPMGQGVKVPPERDAEMARLHAEGMSPGEIGARFGLTRQAVRLRLAKMREAGTPVVSHEPPLDETQDALSIMNETQEARPVDGTSSKSELVAPAPQTEPVSLPAVRAQGTTPAPRPVALVTAAIREVSRSDRPLLGDTRIDKAPPARPGTSDLRRRIAAHLDQLGHAGGWTPLRDLDLFEGVCAARLHDTAERLDVSQEAAASRFKLLCEPIRDPRHGNSPEGQIVMHEVLRARAAPRLEAAE